MKKFSNIALILAFVFVLQVGVTHTAHATGTYNNGEVNYADGYTYDKTKDSSYGDTSAIDPFGSNSNSSGQSTSDETTTTTDTQSTGSSAVTTAATSNIKNLLAKIAALQAEMSKVKTQVQTLLKNGLKEGVTDADVKSIQELLASDPTIYPEGITTGYFGSLTKQALKRFQKKHGLTETGTIDVPTKALLDSYLKEHKANPSKHDLFNDKVVRDHVKNNVCNVSGLAGFFHSFLCKDLRNSTSTPNHTGNDCLRSLMVVCPNQGSTTQVFSGVKVEIVSGTTTVDFKLGSTTYKVVVNSTSQSKVIDAVTTRLGIKLKDANVRLVLEIKKALSKAISDRARDLQFKNTAKRFITTASSTINTVQKDIDDADAEVDTSDAQDLLDSAVTLLSAAQTAFDSQKYLVARTKALGAKAKAHEASTALDDAS